MRSLPIVVAACLAAAPLAAPLPPDARAARVDGVEGVEGVAINRNERPAGTLRDGVLTLALEVREGSWHPEAEDGPGIVVQAFGEVGGPLQIPGPLIRVPAGTEVHATIRNTLDSTLAVRGLYARTARGAPGDTLRIAPHATGTVRFRLEVPGTFLYAARTTRDETLAGREGVDSQLTGAIVVDSAGARPEGDRVFVLGVWSGERDTAAASRPWGEALVINGRAWPHSERITLTAGDTARWRVLNASARAHPMHLHGFYFRLLSRGTMARDSVYAPAQQRLGVTEFLRPGTTMALSWVAERPGNWVFHCHFAAHVSHEARLRAASERDEPALVAPQGHGAHGGHAKHAMSGLVLGVHVLARPGAPAPVVSGRVRQLRLLVQERPGRYGPHAGLGYVVQDGGVEPSADSVLIPGAPLLLVRGEPVRITVVNRLREPTAVHWHGIELESFPDGVPDWSGAPGRLMPPIAPGDSFAAEFTPPRAGTFMYHAHMDESRQIAQGLYAPLLVLEPGQRRNPALDRVLLFSQAGPNPGLGPEGEAAPMLLNGRPLGDTLELRAGVAQRLRFISIRANGAALLRLRGAAPGDSALVTWRPLAKDGADLPAPQRRARPAAMLMSAGETYDYAITLPAGLYALELTNPLGLPLGVVPVRARAAVAQR